jgi:hypothetical protein
MTCELLTPYLNCSLKVCPRVSVLAGVEVRIGEYVPSLYVVGVRFDVRPKCIRVR